MPPGLWCPCHGEHFLGWPASGACREGMGASALRPTHDIPAWYEVSMGEPEPWPQHTGPDGGLQARALPVLPWETCLRTGVRFLLVFQ